MKQDKILDAYNRLEINGIKILKIWVTDAVFSSIGQTHKSEMTRTESAPLSKPPWTRRRASALCKGS